MRCRARSTRVVLAAVTLTAPALAQSALELTASQPAPSSAPSPAPEQSKADSAKEALARRQAALALLDLVLSGARNLSLPQNRIQIASEALPLLWRSNEARARALVTQMVGDFTQAAALPQENSSPDKRNMLRQQWQVVVRTIARSDAGLALSFMNATRSFVPIAGAAEQESEERGLRLELATQEAKRNPRNAMQLAEKELQAPGELDPQLIDLLTQIMAKDPPAGTELLHEIVSRIGSTDLSSGEENFGFALSLLNAQANSVANGAAPDDALKTLADAVAAAALNAGFPSQNLPSLEGSLPALEQFAPARVPALRQKVEEESTPTLPLEQNNLDRFTEALASGDTNQGLALAEQASADARPSMYQQVAWQFASSGNLPRARQVADKLSDPFQRDQVLQQALRQSASNAANQGQFASARQIAQEIAPEEDRAILLAQLATRAASAQQEALALAMLEEAAGLLANRAAGSSVFAAQLQVAQAFAHVQPARAVPLMERSAGQLERVLAAAADVDPFLPSRSFEGGELILNDSFLCNTLIQPYAQAAAELANYDLPVARILADLLSLPEGRLYAELFVARTALGEQNISPATVSTHGLDFGLRIVE